MQSFASDRTLCLLRTCWETSESSVRRLIAERYHVHDEVFITRLLFGELQVELQSRSNSGEFEEAFRSDLQNSFSHPSLRSAVVRMSGGIVARVSYHEPHIEKRTGGDLGLAIARPIVRRESSDTLRYRVAQQGLLSQAKREALSGKFGAFTHRQLEVLRRHLDYAAILLYAYEERREHRLAPFRWLLCANKQLVEIEEYLGDHDAREDTISSATLLSGLWDGRVGTGDDATIAEYICPGDAPYILVEITWRDGVPKGPPPSPSGLTSYSSQSEGGAIPTHHPPAQRVHQMQARTGR